MGEINVDYRTAAKEINKGNVQPIYVCYGAETFLMKEFITYLTDQWIESDDRDFAVSKFDMSETNVEAIIDDAETLPFLGGRKLIIAKDATFFTAAKESTRIEHRIDRLVEYIQAPADYSVIVFTVHADKLDERKKIVKSIAERKALIPFPLLSGDDLIYWVRRQSERMHFSLDEAAMQALILSCGANLQSLSGEMQKLSLYVGKQGAVTAETIETMVVRSTEQNVFLMIDELVRLHVDKALGILYELLKHKEEPVKILSLMARQFRNMLLIKQLSKQGFSQQQMATQLGLHPYAVKVAAEQARLYELDKLKITLSRLADVDYQMKTGKMDKVLALEMFMLQLAG
jgi:DNA polymerase-3 subunit delta